MQTPENSNAGFFCICWGGRSIWGMIVNTMIPPNLLVSKNNRKKNRKDPTSLVLTLGARKNDDDTLALIIRIIQNDSCKEEEPIAFELTAKKY